MLRNVVLTKEKLDSVFEVFAQKILKANINNPINIYIVGGAAIVLNFDYRESTIDIDAMFENDEMINSVIKETANELKMPDDWLNQDFINTPSYSPKIKMVSTLYKTFGDIVNVFYLPPVYLIAMKLKSSRPTGGDMGDIIKMIYELRYKGEKLSYDDVMNAYLFLYPDLSNTYSYFFEKAKEAFETPLEDIESIIKKPY